MGKKSVTYYLNGPFLNETTKRLSIRKVSAAFDFVERFLITRNHKSLKLLKSNGVRGSYEMFKFCC